MPVIEILNDEQQVVDTIIATEEFAEASYPGKWRLADDQPQPEPAPTQVWEWYIDVGPFFDRFGSAKLAVLTSTNPGVQAILKDTQVRKWLDLKLPEIAQSVDYVASVVPAMTPELKEAILTTPVAEHENLALRKLYFSS